MKISINMLLWTTHVTTGHFSLLGRIRQAGFDGVEVPLFGGSEAEFRALRRALDAEGLECTTSTIATEQANPISSDASVRQAALARLRWAIETSHILKADVLAGPFHSPLAVFSGGGPTDDEISRASDVLRDAAEMAAEAKLTLAIESLNRFECYFLTTVAQARSLAERVNHPRFRIMYDTFHAHIEEKDVASAITHAAPFLSHVHVSESDRGVPGTGQVRWPETFQALRDIQYDGWMVIEAFGRALPDLAAATRIWRDLFASDQEVLTRGYSFVKKQALGRPAA
jgi:D-psicose/D-tagatose/L-ribulose 3-epimerase